MATGSTSTTQTLVMTYKRASKQHRALLLTMSCKSSENWQSALLHGLCVKLPDLHQLDNVLSEVMRELSLLKDTKYGVCKRASNAGLWSTRTSC